MGKTKKGGKGQKKVQGAKAKSILSAKRSAKAKLKAGKANKKKVKAVKTNLKSMAVKNSDKINMLNADITKVLSAPRGPKPSPAPATLTPAAPAPATSAAEVTGVADLMEAM